jgi:hypothetical protein
MEHAALAASQARTDAGSKTASGTSKQVPHYMLPNWTSLLPNYSNSESDRIREAFSAGNHAAISKLPKKLECVANFVRTFITRLRSFVSQS